MYYLIYPILYLFSLLPLPVLYLFSDVACLVVYHFVRYRRNIVASNLKQAFPGKSEKERKQIEKKFYLNFTDNFIEGIKIISASPGFINKHFSGDYKICNELFDNGKRCQILFSHTFNWEFCCVAVPLHVKHLFLGVYKPIKNKALNRIFLKMRSKTGAVMLPSNNIRNAILPYRNEVYMLGLIADQNPRNPRHAYWISFFNKLAPFYKAPESSARRGNIPVLFCDFIKRKRGFYTLHFILADQNPASSPESELTKKYVKHLEELITSQPDNYLWSHRRWKHEKSIVDS